MQRHQQIAKVLWILLLICGWAASGCRGCEEKALSPHCTKMFARCQLPKGPIGICQLRACAPGQKKPCLGCVSQH